MSKASISTLDYQTRSWQQLGVYPPLVRDYLLGAPQLEPFYRYAPTHSGLLQACEARSQIAVNREVLVQALNRQYEAMDASFSARQTSREVLHNLEALRDEQTLTVTTGHQLQLFGGVHFFWYKLVDTILLARQLQQERGGKKVVPVFWMASEDHDFEEIRRIDMEGTTWEWQSEQYYGQAVGRLNPAELEGLLEQLRQRLAISQHGEFLSDWLEAAHLNQPTYALAYRQLVHQMLGRYGIVILDADDPMLKAQAKKLFTADVLDQHIGQAVTSQSASLAALGYKTQVTARPVNQFIHHKQGRQRLVAEGGYFTLHEATSNKWSPREMEDTIDKQPELFSPNVITRPILQELLLPNVAYFGGPSEVAYWLQLKAAFEALDVFFPVVMPRNSAFWLSGNTRRKLSQLALPPEAFFQNVERLKAHFLEDQPEVQAFYQQWYPARNAAEALHAESEKLPEELKKVAGSEVQKALHQLDTAAIRLRRRARQQHSVALNRFEQVSQALFPGGMPQERAESFLPYYRTFNDRYFQTLLEAFDPLSRDPYFFNA